MDQGHSQWKIERMDCEVGVVAYFLRSTICSTLYHKTPFQFYDCSID